MPKIKSAEELDAWVANRFPGRQWQGCFKKYLQICKAARKLCKDDDPSLEDCCSALQSIGAPLRFKDFEPAARLEFASRLSAKLVAYRQTRTLVPRSAQGLNQENASSANPATAPGHTRGQASATRADSQIGPLANMASDVEAAPPAKRLCTETEGSTSFVEQTTTAPSPDTTVIVDDSTPAKRPKCVDADVTGVDIDTVPEAAVTPPRSNGACGAVTPARPDTHLSQSTALRLSQSCRKSPLSAPSFAARSEGSTMPLVLNARRQLDEIIRAAEPRLLEAAKPKVRGLYDHFKINCADQGDDYVPLRRVNDKSNPEYDQMRYVRLQLASKLSPHDFKLLALLPRPQNALGPEYYGDVEKCDGGYRWTFVQARVPLCSEAFASQTAAYEALRWIQLELYPVWMNEADRHNHIQYLMRRRTDEQKVAALASEPVLAFARETLTQSLSQPHAATGQRGDLRHDPLVCGFANLGNTCYLNAVTQCLLHCRPFRHDLEATQQGGASFIGDKLKALFEVYKDGTATRSQVRPRLLAFIAQVLRQTGFAGGIQQDAAECLMHLLLSIDLGEMQKRVCGANAVASVESMILCGIADEAQVGDKINIFNTKTKRERAKGLTRSAHQPFAALNIAEGMPRG